MFNIGCKKNSFSLTGSPFQSSFANVSMKTRSNRWLWSLILNFPVQANKPRNIGMSAPKGEFDLCISSEPLDRSPISSNLSVAMIVIVTRVSQSTFYFLLQQKPPFRCIPWFSVFTQNNSIICFCFLDPNLLMCRILSKQMLQKGLEFLVFCKWANAIYTKLCRCFDKPIVLRAIDWVRDTRFDLKNMCWVIDMFELIILFKCSNIQVFFQSPTLSFFTVRWTYLWVILWKKL